MELRQAWPVVRRRWWLIAGLTLATLLVAAALELRGPTAYKAELRLVVSAVPQVPTGPTIQYDPYYYAWLSSEYLADDLAELLKSEAFAQDVSALLGYRVDPLTASNVVRTQKTHRMIDVTVTGSTPQQALEIAEAYEQVARSSLQRYFGQFRAQNGVVEVVNRPEVSAANPLPVRVLNVLLRGLVGLLAGLGLAFALEYLDNTIRDAQEAEEALGLPVLGEIPTQPDLAAGPVPARAARQRAAAKTGS
jgi:capsular polysaccharide biosynthesis protein